MEKHITMYSEMHQMGSAMKKRQEVTERVLIFNKSFLEFQGKLHLFVFTVYRQTSKSALFIPNLTFLEVNILIFLLFVWQLSFWIMLHFLTFLSFKFLPPLIFKTTVFLLVILRVCGLGRLSPGDLENLLEDAAMAT